MKSTISAITLMMLVALVPHTALAQADAAAEVPVAAEVIIEEAAQPIAAEDPTAPVSETAEEAVEDTTEVAVEAAPVEVSPAQPIAETFVDEAPEVAPEAAAEEAAPTVSRQVPDLEIRGDASEAELVERLVVARERYRLTLQALKQQYVTQNNITKLRLVEKELEGLAAVDQPQYLSEVEIAPVDLVARDSIAAADQLFKEGMDFKNYPAWPEEKRGKLRTAVDKFTTLIREYPTSDKISEAAFRLGEIYEGWYYRDYFKAAAAYERAYQWNPRTILPAKFRAAKLYDEKLMQRDKAVELYKQVAVERLYKDDAEFAARRVIQLTGK